MSAGIALDRCYVIQGDALERQLGRLGMAADEIEAALRAGSLRDVAWAHGSLTARIEDLAASLRVKCSTATCTEGAVRDNWCASCSGTWMDVEESNHAAIWREAERDLAADQIASAREALL